MKKRIAVIQPFIGKVYRGNETFFMELVKYLSCYYDFDIYSTGIDETVRDKTIKVECKKGKINQWYEQVYSKKKWMVWLLNRSRYFIFLQPNAFFNRKFSRLVYKGYLKNKQYDLIFPGNGAEGMVQAVRYRRQHGTPVIYKGAGGIGPGEWQVLMLRPDQYICISTKQMKWAEKYWDKVCMIPNGTMTARFQERGNEESFFINKNHKLVISVGNLDMNFKRHHLTINAVAQLDDVDLLILGAGEAEEELRELASQKLPERCIIKSVHYTQVPVYYKSADLFTLPSRDEPFGIVYIEAMAAGLPVVATDDEVRREIIGNAGILCDVENKETYASAIRMALNTVWGNKPREQAQKYDYSIVGEQYHWLIEEMMRQHPYHN